MITDKTKECEKKIKKIAFPSQPKYCERCHKKTIKLQKYFTRDLCKECVDELEYF